MFVGISLLYFFERLADGFDALDGEKIGSGALDTKLSCLQDVSVKQQDSPINYKIFM